MTIFEDVICNRNILKNNNIVDSYFIQSMWHWFIWTLTELSARQEGIFLKTLADGKNLSKFFFHWLDKQLKICFSVRMCAYTTLV